MTITLLGVAANSEIVMIIASLAMLTPLIKALHRWHIDSRKTSKPKGGGKAADTVTQGDVFTGIEGSRWSRMTTFDRVYVIFNLLLLPLLGGFLIWTSMFETPRPATSRDVAFVGLVVVLLVVSSRQPDV